MAAVLGLAGAWAINSKEASDHYTSKIGGFPDFPLSLHQIDSQFLDCNLCKSKLSLVAQIYAPITSKSSTIPDRVLYIFCCDSSHWKALRLQKHDKEEESTDYSMKNSPSIAESVLDSLDNGGSGRDEDMDFEELALALSEATLSASSTKKNRRKSRNRHIGSESVPHLPCFYTYTVEEDCSRRNRCSDLRYCGLGDSEDCSKSEVWGEEKYEHDSVFGVDRSYLKFKKRMDACPEQCFRYGGSPLFVRGCSYHVPEDCDLCGGERSYEVQLMPPLLYFLLEAANEEQKIVIEKWNWMSVLVYTCSDCCFGDGGGIGGWTMAEEAVFVELETPLELQV